MKNHVHAAQKVRNLVAREIPNGQFETGIFQKLHGVGPL